MDSFNLRTELDTDPEMGLRIELFRAMTVNLKSGEFGGNKLAVQIWRRVLTKSGKEGRPHRIATFIAPTDQSTPEEMLGLVIKCFKQGDVKVNR